MSRKNRKPTTKPAYQAFRAVLDSVLQGRASQSQSSQEGLISIVVNDDQMGSLGSVSLQQTTFQGDNGPVTGYMAYGIGGYTSGGKPGHFFSAVQLRKAYDPAVVRAIWEEMDIDPAEVLGESQEVPE